jgi:predicted phosphodiesterase
MRYGIIADIHSNLEALNAALALLRKSGAEAYLCLGDVVGYGPSPNECIAAVQALPGVRVVAGNHDRAVIDQMDWSYFNPYALKAIRWTKNHLTPESIRFLEDLPEKIETDKAFLVHGSPRDPLEEYILSAEQFTANAPLFKQPLCLVAHSHVPFAMQSEANAVNYLRLSHQSSVSLEKGEKTIFNPGAVGQPRDSDPRASCALFDPDAGVLTLLRTEYDIPAVQRLMRDHGLQEFLIQRLAAGY